MLVSSSDFCASNIVQTHMDVCDCHDMCGILELKSSGAPNDTADFLLLLQKFVIPVTRCVT